MTPRRSSTIAIGDGDGQWFLGNAGPDLDAALRECTPLWPRPGDAAAPIHGGFLTDAELDHTVALLSLRERTARIWHCGSANATFPEDAAVIANCPLPEVRRRWLPRIAYHDGSTDGDGGCARWLMLAEAVGLSRAEVIDERHRGAGCAFRSRFLRHFCSYLAVD